MEGGRGDPSRYFGSGGLLGKHRSWERPPLRRGETERRVGGGKGPAKQGERQVEEEQRRWIASV